MHVRPQSTTISLRAITVGVFLCIINACWVIESETVLEIARTTRISLFSNAIFTLFVLTALNLLVRRYFPRLGFNQGELLVVYLMVCLTTALVGTDMLQEVISIVGHAFWFATPENEWQALFWRYLPESLTVSDTVTLRGFYEGESSLYIARHLRAWLTPILNWSVFTLILLFAMLCINSILRRGWTEQEKLSYPIIQLPLEMTRPDSGKFFRNKLLWIGFGVAGGIDIINGLHSLFPAFPNIPIYVTNLGRFFTEKPWNAIGWTPVYLYPFVIGLGFLIPLDLAFSSWFFYIIFWKGLTVFNVSMGLGSSFVRYSSSYSPTGPYTDEQSFGAYIGLSVIALVMGRRYLLFVARQIWRHDEDRNEALPYRYAVLFLILCGIALTLFCIRSGMSLMPIFICFGSYFMLSIGITRMRARLGPPVHDLHYADPGRMLTEVLGPRRVGPRNLSMLSLFYWFTRSYRGHPMAHQLEGFKMAERTHVRYRSLLVPMFLASVVGIICAFWFTLHRAYHIGYAGFQSRYYTHSAEAFTRLKRWLFYPEQTDLAAAAFLFIGFVFTLFLMLLRTRFFWLPLHPVGFAISGSWSMNLIWFPLFLSWLIKWILLKHGSAKAYRKAMPFFLGLILGECTVGSFWIAIGMTTGLPTYIFW